MKRLASILLCFFVFLSLTGCAPGGYINSTDGDITVSLPEKEAPALPEFTDEQRLLLGEWVLVSITRDGTTVTYEDSYYSFAETGTCKTVIDGVKRDGAFKFVDGVLYIDNAEVTYTIENDTLTITSQSTVHLLTKAPEEPQE